MRDPGKLLSALGSSVLPSADLQETLGVSRATLSRLVADAGARVVRIGRTRSTRYALRREIPGLAAAELPIRRIGSDGRPTALGTLIPLVGSRHLFRREAREDLFEGIPPFVDDLRPQGFLGRRFAERHPELQLPARLSDWSADHVLRALATRGEDSVGDLILGDESFDRWLASTQTPVRRAEYPAYAREVAAHGGGSSAAGEHPKFAVWTGEAHALVKYAGAASAGAAVVRWRDLLVAEALALGVIRSEGIHAASARWFDVEDMRLLEVERFDRMGARGRRGVISLGAWDNEFLGTHRTWTSAALEMLSLGQLSDTDARTIRWLDTFGDLIANSDRHFWNLSFFWDLDGSPVLAPAYDMLPMRFAPGPEGVVDRDFQPQPPTSTTLDVWPDAARAALGFWRQVATADAISADFRTIAGQCAARLDPLCERYGQLAQR